MQKQLQILAMSIWLLAFSLTTTAQTTRRVNGDPNITGVNVYNTVQAAVDAANTDDVILIEPWGLDPNATSSSYNEGVTVTKRLHFTGNGYRRDVSTINPLDKRYVDVTSFDFNNGSKGSSMKYISVTAFCAVTDENISISSSRIAQIYLGINAGVTPNSVGSGLHLKKSEILSNFLIDLPNYSTNTIYDDALDANLLVENCILATISTFSTSYPIEGVTVINSNFRSTVQKLNNSTIVNSLFSGGAHNSSQNFNLQISHSIAVNGGLPSLGSNLNNIPTTDIWDNPGSLRGSLKTGSVAIGHGINGEDVGETGGSSPYEESFIPDSPIAIDIQNTQVGNNNINIQVQATYIAN